MPNKKYTLYLNEEIFNAFKEKGYNVSEKIRILMEKELDGKNKSIKTMGLKILNFLKGVQSEVPNRVWTHELSKAEIKEDDLLIYIKLIQEGK